MKPYIGITDFTCFEEVQAMLTIFKESFPLKDRNLMVGTMMSYKTLNGLPTKWKEIFPKVEQFCDIYSCNYDLLLNTLHYADYDNLTQSEDLARAIMIAGHRGPFNPPTINALQLDMPWPSKVLIQEAINSAESLIDESIKEEASLKNLKVILQVGGVAMERMDNDPQRVAQRIRDYDDTIHCVLFDRSGGLGKKMDPDLLRPYIVETKTQCPTISIAIAGGLGPVTMELIEPLVSEFPDISIDAQGRLRKSGNSMDPIDWDLATEYIKKAGEVFET